MHFQPISQSHWNYRVGISVRVGHYERNLSVRMMQKYHMEYEYFRS